MDLNFKKQLEDVLAEGRKADRIDAERAAQFQAIIGTPGWKLYSELINLRIQSFSDALMTPAGGVDGAIALEYVKGAMSGLIIARDLPSVIIAAMTTAVPATDGEDE